MWDRVPLGALRALDEWRPTCGPQGRRIPRRHCVPLCGANLGVRPAARRCARSPHRLAARTSRGVADSPGLTPLWWGHGVRTPQEKGHGVRCVAVRCSTLVVPTMKRTSRKPPRLPRVGGGWRARAARARAAFIFKPLRLLPPELRERAGGAPHLLPTIRPDGPPRCQTVRRSALLTPVDPQARTRAKRERMAGEAPASERGVSRGGGREYKDGGGCCREPPQKLAPASECGLAWTSRRLRGPASLGVMAVGARGKDDSVAVTLMLWHPPNIAVQRRRRPQRGGDERGIVQQSRCVASADLPNGMFS